MTKEFDFLGMIMDALALGELSPKEKFAKAGYLYKKYNRGGIKYDVFIEHFEMLEKEIGNLPTISIIENLSEKKQEKYCDYFLTEYLQMAVNTFTQIISFATNKAPKPKLAVTSSPSIST